MILDGDPRWQRLYNLVCALAHPEGDHRENPHEDEAHDLIRELRGKMGELRVLRAEALAQCESDKNWLRAQRDVAEADLATRKARDA